MTESPDLQSKYQKLASEYAKLRAQIPVLKKGVIDEQYKSEKYKNEVKTRDQRVRKLEQEVDSLTFRNDQLTKRVGVLQQELDGKGVGKNKNKDRTTWHMTSHVQETPVMPSENETVLTEELQSKIEENAKLHKEMYDLNMQHNESGIVLQNQIARYEKEAAEHAQAMESLSSAFKAQVDALLEEKAMLEVRLLTVDSHSKQLKSRADSAEMQLCSISQELSIGLTSSFSQDDVSRSVSVQSFAATPDLEETSPFLIEAVAFGKQFVHSLSNYFMYSEQRTSNFPGDLSDINLAPLLHKASNYLKPLDSALKTIAEKNTDRNVNIKDLSEAFSRFLDYHVTVTSLQITCLEKENSCLQNDELQMKNRDVHKALDNFHSGFKRLSEAICFLSSAMKSDRDTVTLERPYRDILAALQFSLENGRELSKQCNAKVSLEQRLDASHKFKAANECVVSSLISLVTVQDKLANLLRSNIENVTKVQYSTHSPASVKSLDSLDTTAITSQVATLKDKLLSLESEREHWMLETQLLQAKMDEKNRQISEMEKLVSKSDDVEANITRAPDTISDDSDQSPYLDLTMLGTITSAPASGDHTGNDVTMREKLIKEHYSQRLSDLASQLHLSDSKSVNFYHECHSLHQRLTAMQKHKNRLEAELDISMSDCKQLKEESSTTSARYEDQMNLMSEHIAQLNDQLAAHREQLDTMKMLAKSKTK